MLPAFAGDDMRAISAPIDFLGINYYWRHIVTAEADGDPVVVDPLGGWVTWVLAALRHRLHGLRDAGARPEGELPLVPGRDRGAAERRRSRAEPARRPVPKPRRL